MGIKRNDNRKGKGKECDKRSKEMIHDDGFIEKSEDGKK